MPGLQEYVIRLSADVDNMGVQKLMSIMDTNKMKALGLTAALTAATTAVYKWVESATKQEMELDKLAKKQKKSIEQTRAEQEALKQMGMTLDEIKKDKALKEIYDDLVKFNKEMQMPNAANMLGKVRELQTAFWKLKSAVSYLVQSIGSQLLINLEKPIERITNTLGKGANWLKNNLTSIGTKIAGYLTAFAKGVIGIAEGVGKIFNWLSQMPEGIKSIAGTIATVFALIKSGPIGQIMALITAAGDLIHDYENSQWNKENRENTKLWNDGKGGYTDVETEFGAYQVPLAYENLWNFLEGNTDSLREKAKTIFMSVLEGIRDALNEFTDTLNNGQGLTEWLESLTGPVGDILGGIQDVFSSPEGQTAVGGVITSFFTTAASLCKAGGAFGSQIVSAVAGMIANIFGMQDIWNDSNVKAAFEGDNGFANGLMTTIETALIGGNWWESLLTGVLGGYQTERTKALQKLYQQDHANEGIDWGKVVWGENGIPSYTELESMYGSDSRLAGMLGSGVQESFNTFIKGVLEMLVGGINIASDTAGNILKTIIQAIIQSLLADSDGISANIAEAMNSEGASDVFDAIGAGIGTWIVSGNFFVGILGSVVSFISQSIATAKEQNKPLWDTMKEKIGDFWDSIQDIIYGPLIDGEFNSDGSQKRDRQYGLISVLEPLLWGEMETVGDTVQNVLEEAEDKVTGKKYFARKGGILNWLLGYDTAEVGTGAKFHVKGIFEKLWEGSDGESGLKGIFTSLGEKIVSWLEPAFAKLGDLLAIALYNALEASGILGALEWAGIEVGNPNKSTIVDETDASGKTVHKLKSTNGREKVLTDEEYDYITHSGTQLTTPDSTSDNIRYNLSINPDGKIVDTRFADGGTGEHAFSTNAQNYHTTKENAPEGAIFLTTEDVLRLNENPPAAQTPSGGYGPGNWEGNKLLPDEVAPAEIPTEAQEPENVGAVIEAAQATASASPVHIPTTLDEPGTGGSETRAAMGGRFDSPTSKRIAEAGTEYVIPVTKPERAFSLILQALSEMGSDMIKRVTEHFGGSLSEGVYDMASGMASRVGKDFALGTSGTVGGSLGGIESALQNMQQNFNYNISAPVTIQVQSSGASAQEIGTAAYDAAERRLLKTLRGAYA